MTGPTRTRRGICCGGSWERRSAGHWDKLTPRERMVFELKHYHGLKLRTVGEMLNTTEETAKNTLFRARRSFGGRSRSVRDIRGGDGARRGQAI